MMGAPEPVAVPLEQADRAATRKPVEPPRAGLPRPFAVTAHMRAPPPLCLAAASRDPVALLRPTRDRTRRSASPCCRCRSAVLREGAQGTPEEGCRRRATTEGGGGARGVDWRRCQPAEARCTSRRRAAHPAAVEQGRGGGRGGRARAGATLEEGWWNSRPRRGNRCRSWRGSAEGAGGAAGLHGAGEGDCRSRKERERVVGRPPLLPPPRVAAAGRAPAHAGPPASAHRRRYGCGACPPAHAAARSRLARNGTARPPAPPREEGRGAPRGEDGRRSDRRQEPHTARTPPHAMACAARLPVLAARPQPPTCNYRPRRRPRRRRCGRSPEREGGAQAAGPATDEGGRGGGPAAGKEIGLVM